MNLRERIAGLRARVETMAAGRRELEEASALQVRQGELAAVGAPLQSAARRRTLYRMQGLRPAGLGRPAERLSTRVERLRERFRDDSRNATLTRGVQWRDVLDQAKEAARSAENELTGSWRRYVESAFAGERPAELEGMLAPTELNRSALARYRTAYERLVRLRNEPADSVEAFGQVREIAGQLASIHETFDFDVPVAVKIFLQATGRGGASLDLLTEEVREWLRANSSYNRYLIVARNAGG